MNNLLQIEDLRTSNWSPLFDNILKAIQEKVKLTFALAQKPSDPATVGVYLNDKKLDTGWTYNAADNTITLEPGSAGADDKIVVVYTRD